MSALFKIFRASAKETKLAKIESAIAKYGKTLEVATPLRNLTRDVDGIVRIGGEAAEEVSRLLRSGYIDKAASHIYTVKNVPSVLRSKLVSDVVDLPAFKLGETARSTEKLKDFLKADMSAADYATLSGEAKYTAGAAEAVAKRSVRFKSYLDAITAKRVLSMTGAAVVVTAGVSAVVYAVEQHRDSMNGCMRYTVVNGNMQVCKVVECSCNGQIMSGKGTPNAPLCSSDVEVPAGMRDTTNCSERAPGSGYGCVKCPIVAPDTTADGETLDSLEDGNAPTVEDDVVTYVCNQYSFLDALGDATSSGVLDTINTVKDTIVKPGGELLKTVFGALKYVAIGAAIFILIFISFWGYTTIRKKQAETTNVENEGRSSVSDDEEDDDAVSGVTDTTSLLSNRSRRSRQLPRPASPMQFSVS